MATYSTTAGSENGDGFGTTSARGYAGHADATGFGSDRTPVTLPGLENAAGTSDTETINHRTGYGMASSHDVVEFSPAGYDGFATKSANRAFPGVGSYSPPVAAYIPSAYFRRVTGVAVNPDGQPIENAVWVIAQDGLPTAGKVDDSGRFKINLLRTTYQSFALLVEAEQYQGLDYVWYQYKETIVDSTMAEIVLVFEESKVSSGLSVGPGVSMG